MVAVRKRPRRLLVAALTAALAAGLLVSSLGSGSSHREAPAIALDPTADNTDVYAFTASDAPGSLTVVANWIPLEDPAGGPNFFRFDDNADYYINIDNTGEGKPDVRYLFKFKTKVRDPQSFLYALPGVTGFDDPKLNIVQTYDVFKEDYVGGRFVHSNRIAHDVHVAPNNVGPKTIAPAVYANIANGSIKHLERGGKVFGGQRDDPFFVDLGATFDAINLRLGTGNAGGGKDDLAGLNTHAIVLQVPEREVTRDHRPVSAPDAADAVVGVWSSTDRQTLSIKRNGKARHRTVQVSRLGNPLVNEVVIPLGKKDQFNRTTPDKDAQYGAFVVEPQLAKVLNALFGLNIKETGRTDIVTALLTGVPGATQIAKGAPPTDTLKLNLGIPPTPAGSEKSLGFIAGDNAGFPDGRRLGDDVVDAELRVVGGYLLGTKLPLGDGVDHNDVPFLSAFPYLALPHDGFDSAPKRTEPPHAPTPADVTP
ncbi:MAG: hypothetical protein QOJ35_1941 [Solirubrobacteraceae bacterium]|nr:hypothetical protein [Solirubrobacteraceae bacterium]